MKKIVTPYDFVRLPCTCEEREWGCSMFVSCNLTQVVGLHTCRTTSLQIVGTTLSFPTFSRDNNDVTKEGSKSILLIPLSPPLTRYSAHQKKRVGPTCAKIHLFFSLLYFYFFIINNLKSCFFKQYPKS